MNNTNGTPNLQKCTDCGIYYPSDKGHKCEGPYSKEAITTKGLKFDDNKLEYSLIPPETLEALASVLTFGAKKYDRDNWKSVKDAERRYLDALFRHLEAYRKGEILDPESGLPHLSHVLTNAAFLQYLTKNKD